LQAGYKATTAAKFIEALSHFEYILSAIPLLVVQTRTEANEVRELVSICREYVLGLKMELKRKEIANSPNPDSTYSSLFWFMMLVCMGVCVRVVDIFCQNVQCVTDIV
jgi:hypothetical protein